MHDVNQRHVARRIRCGVRTVTEVTGGIFAALYLLTCTELHIVSTEHGTVLLQKLIRAIKGITRHLGIP